MFNPCQNRISIESVNRYPVGVRPALITGKDDFDEIFREVYWNVPFKKSSELLDELERYMDFDIPEPSAQFKSDKDEINTGDITQ